MPPLFEGRDSRIQPPRSRRTARRTGRRTLRLTFALAALMTLASVAAAPSSQSAHVTDLRAPRVELTALARTRTVVVTLASHGETRLLHRGDRLVVRLTGPSMYTWTAPSSSRTMLLTRLSSSSGSVGAATFLARSPGRVLVSAVDNPNCYPQCLPPSRVFTLHVVIVR